MKSVRTAVLILTTLMLAIATATTTANAQIFTTLYSFDGTDGASPFATVTRADDGNLYGTTVGGGASGAGTVYQITPSGMLTTVHNFCSQSACKDGEDPYVSLTQATNGNLYGEANGGGVNGGGTIFKIGPGGVLTTLYSFCGQSNCADGQGPGGAEALLQATNGNFYGATEYGGANGDGTVFTITPGGTLTTLHSFLGTDGATPIAGLTQATNGYLYGTTHYGGTNGGGTVYKITLSGTLTTLYNFCSQSACRDGANPWAGLTQASDGNLYGTTSSGGTEGGYGTVFRITPGGTLTTVHSFDGTDGSNPNRAPIQATDGNLYGTTAGGGANGKGTVFTITPGGTLTTLYNFCSQSGCADGATPIAGLFQNTDGSLYGTTWFGGNSGDGTVYSLDMGLGPFVRLVPAAGKVGQTGGILGQGLTGTTSVSLNGTPVSFTVKSDTYLTATVPAGATTGFVTVTTPSGTLTSNVPFHVLP